MKQFIKKIIERLPIITGYDQKSKLSRQQMISLVEELVAECNRHRIPSEVKEKIIEDGCRSEHPFYGLNVALINKWMYSWKVQNQVAGRTSGDDDGYWKIKQENDRKYKRQLEEERKKDPGYNPEKEFMKQMYELANRKSVRTGPGGGSRLRKKFEDQ